MEPQRKDVESPKRSARKEERRNQSPGRRERKRSSTEESSDDEQEKRRKEKGKKRLRSASRGREEGDPSTVGKEMVIIPKPQEGQTMKLDDKELAQIAYGLNEVGSYRAIAEAAQIFPDMTFGGERSQQDFNTLKEIGRLTHMGMSSTSVEENHRLFGEIRLKASTRMGTLVVADKSCWGIAGSMFLLNPNTWMGDIEKRP